MSLVAISKRAGLSLSNSSILVFCILLAFSNVSHAAVKLIEPPKKEVFVGAGEKAVIAWDYTVDDRDAELQPFAFNWLVAVPPYSTTKKTIKQELRDGTRQVGGDIPSYLRDRADVTGKATLEITDVTRNDSNTYFFEIRTGSFGTLSSAVNLTVTVPPVTKMGEKSVVASPGESKTLICEATGVPTPNITWAKWGSKESLLPEQVAVVGGAYSNLTLNATLQTRGEYVCTASLPTSEMSDASAYFSVKHISAPASAFVECNSKRVCCPASGFPQPIYHWTFPNGTLLTTNTDQCLSGDSLKVGQYVCRASNSIGDSKTNVTFCSESQMSIKTNQIDTSKVEINWIKKDRVGPCLITARDRQQGNRVCYVSAGETHETVIDYYRLDSCMEEEKVDLEVMVLVQQEGTGLVGRVNVTIGRQ